MRLSRRALLKACLAILPGLAGARALSNWIRPFGSGASGATNASLAAVAASARTRNWAFVCDTTKCIGCGRCVEACKLENHVPLDPEFNRTWVERHVVAADGSVTISSPAAGIHGFPATSTASAHGDAEIRQAFFVPRLCMQCENPPCISVCPVSATYKTSDGVVLVDQDRCIGCGYCVVACPYGSRYLLPAGGVTPTGNAGVADKCTWCYHRISRGHQPACTEVCPVGARIFGDLDDQFSLVNEVLRRERVQVMKPALGTKPRVYYVGLEAEVG